MLWPTLTSWTEWEVPFHHHSICRCTLHPLGWRTSSREGRESSQALNQLLSGHPAAKHKYKYFVEGRNIVAYLSIALFIRFSFCLIFRAIRPFSTLLRVVRVLLERERHSILSYIHTLALFLTSSRLTNTISLDGTSSRNFPTSLSYSENLSMSTASFFLCMSEKCIGQSKNY